MGNFNRFWLIHIHPCDRQTDGRTDRWPIAYSALCCRALKMGQDSTNHQRNDWLSMVLRLHQHNIGYTADVTKEMRWWNCTDPLQFRPQSHYCWKCCRLMFNVVFISYIFLPGSQSPITEHLQTAQTAKVLHINKNVVVGLFLRSNPDVYCIGFNACVPIMLLFSMPKQKIHELKINN